MGEATLKSDVLSDKLSTASTIDLLHQKISYQDRTSIEVSLDEWPILVFLRGIGVESIQLNNPSNEVLQEWAARMVHYQQEFLADPGSLIISDSQWDQKELDGSYLIQSIFAKVKETKRMSPNWQVPPLMAPVQLSSEACERFVEEIRSQPPLETLRRFSAILFEHQHSNKKQKSVQLPGMIFDTIILALKYDSLDRALIIAEQHRADFHPAWADKKRLELLLSGYDPKPQEIGRWATLFESCDSIHLIESLRLFLGTPAGPQLLKILSYRAQTRTESVVTLCFDQPWGTQKILLNLLSAQWKPQHFDKIKETFEKVAKRKLESEALRVWGQALLRSSFDDGLKEFLKFFNKRKWFVLADPEAESTQLVIVDILAEHPSEVMIKLLESVVHKAHMSVSQKIRKLLRSWKALGL